LNYNESILIFNNISNSIKFIEALEKKKKLDAKDIADNNDDLPFLDRIIFLSPNTKKSPLKREL
jgi:hypothetical protein